jgi:hypothetical protein
VNVETTYCIDKLTTNGATRTVVWQCHTSWICLSEFAHFCLLHEGKDRLGLKSHSLLDRRDRGFPHAPLSLRWWHPKASRPCSPYRGPESPLWRILQPYLVLSVPRTTTGRLVCVSSQRRMTGRGPPMRSIGKCWWWEGSWWFVTPKRVGPRPTGPLLYTR